MAAAAVAAVYFARVQAPADHVRTDFMMDTVVRITLSARYREDADLASARMRALAAIFDDYRPQSDISRINSSQDAVRVSADTASLLKEAMRCSRLTEGAFDITAGGISALWGFKNGKTRVPQSSEIASVLSSIGWRRLELLPDNRARRALPAVRVDVGGIAKGYAVDQAVELLQERGVGGGIIDAGGDLRCWGRKPDGKPWIIGIQHPRREDALLGRIQLDRPFAVATSGDYQRFFKVGSKRYCHIMNPFTGYPAEGVISATILAPTAAEADAFATAVCVLGPEKGLRLLRRCGRDGILVTAEGFIRKTPGMDQVFKSEVGHGAGTHI